MRKTLLAAAVLLGLTAAAVGQQPVGPAQLVQEAAAYVNITTATTTAVKATSGILFKVCINKYVASGVIAIYDNTAGSGSLIGTITNPGTLLFEGPICAEYNAVFATGLTIVTTGAQDITVTYR